MYYASRKLTEVEGRYFQFDRECLGVKWVCKKLQLYLIEKKFEVQADHKTLLTVLSKRTIPPSARVERWILFQQQFEAEVIHIKGRENHTNILSRAPEAEGDQDESRESNIFAYMHSVIEDARPGAITREKMSLETSKENTITMLKQAIELGEWHKFQGSIYKAVKDELRKCGNIVMRGGRIVMPESLWKHTLRLAHKGHQGMVRTKARLHCKVRWPQMDNCNDHRKSLLIIFICLD